MMFLETLFFSHTIVSTAAAAVVAVKLLGLCMNEEKGRRRRNAMAMML
jgi:hypothetical protein